MPDLLSALRDAVDRHTAPHDGPHLQTAIPDLVLMRGDSPTVPFPAVYEPALCLVLQGAKRVALDSLTLDYAAGQYLVVSVGLPFVGQITQATPAEPYLTLLLRFDAGTLLEVAEQLGRPEPARTAGPSAFVGTITDGIAESALRLMRLLNTPEAIPILAPSAVRELTYWLLAGPDGARLRRHALPNGHTQRIAHAAGILRAEFDRPVRVARLAEAASMSPSAFHVHFKAATAMTPLQYQKRLRLLEARRLLAGGATSAADAGFRVGYESASQFSREYARFFGAPPARDRARRDPAEA